MKPNSSSLSTLSTALKKLEMPAPSRPNTSLGFNHDASCDINEAIPPETGDKSGPSNSNSLKRSFTVGHTETRTTSSDTPLNQMAPPTKKPRLVQKPMTMFFSRSGSSSTSTSTLSNSSSTEKTVFGDRRPFLIRSNQDKGKTLFKGLGNRNGPMFPATNKRLVQKVSRKTTLPTVEASPVKGGSNNVLSESVGNQDDNLDSFPLTSGSGGLEGIKAADNMNNMFLIPLVEENDEVHASGGINGKKSTEKGKSKPKDSSRRASMALSQLSESLCTASLYCPEDKVIMGPPATPRKVARSISSTYPGPSKFVSEEPAAGDDITTAASSTSPDKHLGSGGKRSSARQAAKVALNAETKSPAMSADFFGPAQKGGTDKEKLSVKKTESWGVLKDCKIFVDVRTDDGEEAGSLFMEMLENLGAKVRCVSY